ncbi:hypothetical protein PR003_g18488 [Phytophthora rubi]|uniref:PiggyBac transposable element-derived protein domain-containing protein n=1 Tax=Phytophthora rubi TaxID=129364 RepID=A0A6A4E071_9STRA|nr:hypothetical protein PR003_g18488 [Phytophthora rubi]
MWACIYKKSFSQIWRELTKKGWTYRKSTGLSNNQRYLPPGGDLKGTEGVDFFDGEASLLRYCRSQGWLAFAPAHAVTTAADAAPITHAAGSPAGTAHDAGPLAEALPTPSEAVPTPILPARAEPTSTTPSLASADPKKAASPKPRAAAKAASAAGGPTAANTPQASTKATGRQVPRSASNSTAPPSSKRRRTDLLVQENDSSVPADTVQTVPEGTVGMQDNPGPATTEATSLPRAAGRGISLDDFDSDNFLDALRRDLLFEATDSDDLNIGGEDWLLALDSDAEGDEDSILLDEDDDEEDDPATDFPVDDENDDDVGSEFDSVPVEFDLTGDDLDKLQADEWETYDEHHSSQVRQDALPLYDGPFGPTRAALAYAENPLAIFYFFLPKELWRRVATETNKFCVDSIDEIAAQMRAGARQRRERTPSTIVLSVDEYKTKLKRKSAIQPHEIIRFIGLLVARALEPRRESLSRHWITRVEGALSRGTFGQFLSRDRFHDIARYLHFNDNEKQADSGDRAFKIRPVIQALQKTLFRGYRLGARISFDEGMVPMRHRRNPMRQYMPAKPNKWGTKFYLTCCADSAYCSRLEIYCGKANDDESAVAQQAVVKNMTQVLRGQPSQRLICTDNFYTSIPLSHKLLSMGNAHVGTIRKDRKGWCTKIEFKQKKRPKRMPRGTCRMAVWRGHPEFVAVTWMDNKPRYSIQRAIRMRKYYKTIFLGLVDIAMVNAFIIHKMAMRRRGKPVPTHAAFMRRLHTGLLNQTSEDFSAGDDLEDLVTEPLPRQPHTLEKTEELNGTKRRQWLCKVCSAYAGPDTRSFETSYFCAECSRVKKGRVTLCNKTRRLEHGSALTCNEVWHQSWKNGMAIPPEMQHKIRFVGKRRPEVASEGADE